MMEKNILITFLAFLCFASCDIENEKPSGSIQLTSIRVGTYKLDLSNYSKNTNAPTDQPIVGTFSASLNTENIQKLLVLKLKRTNEEVPLTFAFFDNNKTFSAQPAAMLKPIETYIFSISAQLKGESNESFPGYTVEFFTVPAALEMSALTINQIPALNSNRVQNVSRENLAVDILFRSPLNPLTVTSETITMSANGTFITCELSLSDQNKRVTISPLQPLKDFTKHHLVISNAITGANAETFATYTREFYTGEDSIPDFPIISDEDLLTLIQQQTFKYFWDFAHPTSGMARERNTSGDIVTSGGSGFGLMAIIVGIERNFITRQQGIERLNKILSFLETADRFHGAWSHWINGITGKVVPFSTKDNGGDLVETSFLVQGLLTFRQYLNPGDATELALINRINVLWEAVEWDWYRKNNENVLYWQWSPNYNWETNFPMYGYFEEQITYFLAAASPTYSIPKIVYTNGYGKNGAIVKNNIYYGYKLPLENPAPLFWVHYSYLGLDPHFSDDFANYWEQNVNATLINQAYCIANPKNFVGYSEECWGLTSSDNPSGYKAHSPANDLGVIAPTAALSSFPYTPEQSMKALKFFYYKLGDRLWGPYGFYDAFNLTEGWVASSYLAIDQGPIIIMIENHRTGLLWNLFMSAPEVQAGVTKLSFNY